jgi:ribosomal protein S27AE
MKVITSCPRCGEDFMYDPIWDYDLFRVETGEVNKTIVICQNCKEDEINQQEAESVE